MYCDFINCLSEYLLKGMPCIQFSSEAVWIILCCNKTVRYLHTVLLKNSSSFMVLGIWAETSFANQRWAACATSLNSKMKLKKYSKSSRNLARQGGFHLKTLSLSALFEDLPAVLLTLSSLSESDSMAYGAAGSF